MSGSDLCIPRNETAQHRYFQNIIIMFCLSPNFHIHVSDFIHPGSVCIFCCSQIFRLILEYTNRSQIHERRNWEQDRAVSYLGTHKSDFWYSVSTHPEDWSITSFPMAYIGCPVSTDIFTEKCLDKRFKIGDSTVHTIHLG